MEAEETVWFLEMLDPSELRPPSRVSAAIEVRQACIPCVALNYYFYCTIGKPWNWTDRFRWTSQQWRDYVLDARVETWIGYVEGTPAGYAEIQRESDGNVSIESFGLIPQFVGQGIGGHFLTEVIRIAWRKQARRVWLHTCSFDHPSALRNYQARGLRLYDTIQQTKIFPDGPVEPPV
jgi:GNAT superfamily N-acetyltransferase